MQKSTQLIMVYAELRRALGNTVTAGEVLDLAKRLTDLANRQDIIDRCGTVDFSTPGCIPLDRAFDDGGWWLLSDAYASGMISEDFEPDNSWQPRRSASHLLEHMA